MLEELLAKSNLGIKLVDHTKDVINVSMFLFDDGYVADYYKYKQELRYCLALSAMFHDIGKCTEREQSILREESTTWKDKVRHNMVGERFILDYVSMKSKDELRHIAKLVRFHHIPLPVSFGDNGIERYEDVKISEIDYNTMREFTTTMHGYVKEVFGIDDERAVITFNDFGNGEERMSIVNFYEGLNPLVDDCEKSLGWMVALQILAKADRLVSSLYETADACTLNAITSNDQKVIGAVVRANEKKFTGDKTKDFKDPKYELDLLRFAKQEKIINDVEYYFEKGTKTCLIQEYPGFGKTLCGVILSARYNGKVIWCSPTRALAEQTFNTLVEYTEKYGINDTIGLFYGGRYQRGNKEPKISVCVIDTYLSKEKQNGNMVDFLESSKALLILDEYHEFEGTEALFAAYYRLMYTRMLITGGNTVLISATPLKLGGHELLCQGSLGDDSPNFIREICKPSEKNQDEPDYGNKNGYDAEYPNKEIKFNVIEVESYSDVAKFVTNDSITITSTVRDCQEISKMIPNSLCVHARFTKSDRMDKESELIRLYGKSSTVPESEKNPVVMSPIAGTGIDISTNTMNTFLTKPSDLIQFQGRLGRFGGIKECTLNLLYFKDGCKDGGSSNKKAKNFYKVIEKDRSNKPNETCVRIDKYFIAFIKKLAELEQPIKFKDLCETYEEFMMKERTNLTRVMKYHMERSVSELSKISFSRAKNNENQPDEIILPSYQNFRGKGNQVYATSDALGDDVIEIETDVYGNNGLRDYIDVKKTYKKYKKVLGKYALRCVFGRDGNTPDWDRVWSLAKSQEMPVVLRDDKHTYSSKFGLSLKS